MNNNSQGCTDDNCPTCSMIKDLTLEFGEMVSDNVAWDKALEYVLRSALDSEDLEMEELIRDVYGSGFSDGLKFGIEQSKRSLDELYEGTVEMLSEDELNVSEIDDDVIIFKDEDDTDDKIQKIIKRNQ